MIVGDQDVQAVPNRTLQELCAKQREPAGRLRGGSYWNIPSLACTSFRFRSDDHGHDNDGLCGKKDGAPLSLTILTTAGMADWMVGDLDAVGIHVEVILVPTEDAYTQMNEMIAAGESVLWLSARFSDIGRVSPTPTPPPPPTPTPDNQGPPAPSLVSPTGGEMLECGSVTLDWNAVSDPSGIDTYYVKVETVTGIFKSEEWETTDTEFTIPAAWVECGFEHRWAVRAEDGAGNVGPWSDWEDFAPTIG